MGLGLGLGIYIYIYIEGEREREREREIGNLTTFGLGLGSRRVSLKPTLNSNPLWVLFEKPKPDPTVSWVA